MNFLQECMSINVIERYERGYLGSRELLRQMELIAGTYELAVDVLESNGFSAAELWARDEAPTNQRSGAPSGITIQPDDPDITVEAVTYPGQAGTLMGYVAQPSHTGSHAGVIVIHENRGVNEHIRDVARRFAKAGYVALAPDLLARVGGTDHFETMDDLQASLRNIPPESFMEDLGTAIDYLKGLSATDPDRIGVTGFCFGGGLTWRIMTNRQDLKAGAPFYGAAPPSEDVPKIKAAVLAIYGETDERINATIPALEEALQGTGIRYEKVVYPGAGHAFHNDTGERYDQEAASDAWNRTLAHFGQHLV